MFEALIDVPDLELHEPFNLVDWPSISRVHKQLMETFNKLSNNV